MKKSKILVSTALALCMGATAVIPAFAAENQKALCRIVKIRQRAINFAVPPLVCFILANKASRSANFTLLRCNARTRQSLLFLSARCSGW